MANRTTDPGSESEWLTRKRRVDPLLDAAGWPRRKAKASPAFLFVQMLGHGTRLGERYPDKSHFTVFDCFDGTLLGCPGSLRPRRRPRPVSNSHRGGRASPADFEPRRQPLGEVADMRDDADHPVAAAEGVQSADDNGEGVGVQGAEAFRPSRRIRVALGGQMSPVKEEAKRLIDELPDTATWDDVMYELYVRMKIARGVAAAQAGDVVPHEEAKRRILAE